MFDADGTIGYYFERNPRRPYPLLKASVSNKQLSDILLYKKQFGGSYRPIVYSTEQSDINYIYKWSIGARKDLLDASLYFSKHCQSYKQPK